MLRESAARLRAVVDTAVDGVILIDAHGLILKFNPACERLFRYQADEVIGQNVRMLMPEPYRSEHDGYIRNFLTTGEKKIIGIGREVVGRRKDGSTFPMDLSVGEAQAGWILDFRRHHPRPDRSQANRGAADPGPEDGGGRASSRAASPTTSTIS